MWRRWQWEQSKQPCWRLPLLLFLWYENRMDVVTLLLVPRFKSSIQSDARHFLHKARFLLFVQIQNVPGTHSGTQDTDQITAVNIFQNQSWSLNLNLVCVSNTKSKSHSRVTVFLVTVLSPWQQALSLLKPSLGQLHDNHSVWCCNLLHRQVQLVHAASQHRPRGKQKHKWNVVTSVVCSRGDGR